MSKKTIHELAIAYTGDTKDLRKSAKQAEKIVGKSSKTMGRSLSKSLVGSMSRAAKKMGATLKRSASGMGALLKKTLGSPLALIGGGMAAAMPVKWAADFQDGMLKVETLLDATTKKHLPALEAGVRKLSRETGKGADELLEGLYQSLSSGVDPKMVSGFMESATKAAIGGGADVSDVVQFAALAVKAYGKEWKDTGEILDVALKTQNLGVTTMAELAANMPRVIAAAGQLGVEYKTVMGATAALTGVTGNTAEVSTQLAGVLNSMLKMQGKITVQLKQYTVERQKATKMGDRPAVAAMNAEIAKLKQLAGAVSPATLRTKGLGHALNALVTATGGSEEKILALTGRAEAFRAIMALTGKQADAWAVKTKAMGDSAGEAARAYETRMKGFSKQIGVLWQVIKDIGIGVGAAVLPTLTKIADNTRAFLEENRRTIIGLFGGALRAALGFGVAVAGVFMKIGGTLATLAENWKTVFEIISTSTKLTLLRMMRGLSVTLGDGVIAKTLLGSYAIGASEASKQAFTDTVKAFEWQLKEAGAKINKAIKDNPLVKAGDAAMNMGAQEMVAGWDKVANTWKGGAKKFVKDAAKHMPKPPAVPGPKLAPSSSSGPGRKPPVVTRTAYAPGAPTYAPPASQNAGGQYGNPHSAANRPPVTAPPVDNRSVQRVEKDMGTAKVMLVTQLDAIETAHRDHANRMSKYAGTKAAGIEDRSFANRIARLEKRSGELADVAGGRTMFRRPSPRGAANAMGASTRNPRGVANAVGAAGVGKRPGANATRKGDGGAGGGAGQTINQTFTLGPVNADIKATVDSPADFVKQMWTPLDRLLKERVGVTISDIARATKSEMKNGAQA